MDLRSFKLERPDHPLHYRNLPAQHAPSYFRSLIKRIKALELIPSGSEQFGRKYYGHRDTIVVRYITVLAFILLMDQA